MDNRNKFTISFPCKGMRKYTTYVDGREVVQMRIVDENLKRFHALQNARSQHKYWLARTTK